MKDDYKFVYKITCEPQLKVEPNNDFTALVEKLLTIRVKEINDVIIDQIRLVAKEKGITQLIAIDESKLAKMVNDLEVLEIIGECPIILHRIFENDKELADYKKRYFFGTITDDKVDKVKEWLTRH